MTVEIVGHSLTIKETKYVGLQITSSQTINEETQTKVHIALVIDTSGSMEGDRIASVIKTLVVLINTMQDGDIISVVSFASGAKDILKKKIVSAESRPGIIETIHRLYASGGTCMEAGIHALADMYRNTDHKPNAIVLLTDGHIHTGIKTKTGLHSLFHLYMPGVPVFTLGYGSDHNSDILTGISQRTQAVYTYIDSEIVLPTAVGDILGGIQTEVALRASIYVPPSWKCIDVFRPEGQGQGQNGYMIGSIIADKPTWVMFSVEGQEQEQEQYTLTYTDKTTMFECSLTGSVGAGQNEKELQEQFYRCQMTRLLDSMVPLSEEHQYAQVEQGLRVFLKELVESEVSMSPLIVSMRAKLNEMLEKIQARETDVSYQLMSSAMNYGAQRGGNVFSSPRMIHQTQTMVSNYQGGDTMVEDPC